MRGVGGGARMRRRQHPGVEAERRTVGLLERQPDRHRIGRGRDERVEGAHREHGGTKGRVECGGDAGRNERERSVRVHPNDESCRGAKRGRADHRTDAAPGIAPTGGTRYHRPDDTRNRRIE